MSISAMIYTTSMPPGGTRKSWITSAKPAGILPIWPQPGLPHHSIEQVVACLMDRQKDYFLHHRSLRPLRQKDIAADTQLSTATVSRVCRHRYVLFEGRIYPLQSFLATAYPSDTEGSVSDKVIMEKIAALIASEDKSHPYSDQDLSECLALSDRISVARRTVTKLRQKLNIPNSRIRRL